MTPHPLPRRLPLPRLHAVTDHSILARADFADRVRAVAKLGPRVALHARDRDASDRALYHLAAGFIRQAERSRALVFVNARGDIARAVGADGLQLGSRDLAPGDARTVFPAGWIGVSVHDEREARRAVAEGADFLLAGSIFDTGTHPGRPAAGLELIERLAPLGLPVVAIGGITPARVAAVRRAGAWGVAAVSALWLAPDTRAAARALLAPWRNPDD